METPILNKLLASIDNKVQREIFRKQYDIDEAKLKDEIKFIIDDRKELKKIVLFLIKERSTEKIFNALQEIEAFLDFKEYATELNRYILLEILNSRSDYDAEKIFAELKDINNFYFWSIIRSLPFVLSQYKLEPGFASKWFYIIGEKIKEDLASGDFFTALGNYAYNFPKESLDIFNIYMDEGFPGLKQLLSSIILGSIRAAIRDKKYTSEIISIEEKLKNSNIEEWHIIFYKSWSITYYRNTASIEEIMEIIREANNGKQKEVNEAFLIMFRTIVKDLTNEEVIVRLLSWVKNTSSNQLSPESKYQIINSLYYLVTFDKKIKNIDNRAELYLSIFSQILPIETTQVGTWKKIEELMISLINRKKETLFKQYFDTIIHNSLNPFLELLSKNHFQRLEHCLKGNLADNIFTQLLFSSKEEDIRTAIELFKKINDLKIIKPNKEPSIDVLSKILLEFSRNILLSNGTSKFLLLIEPFFQNVKDDLKGEFIKEMVFQAVNYRKSCFDEWSKIENLSNILKEVIEKAKNYYDKLRTISELPARNISYYKFEEGAELERKMQSRDLNKKVNENSVFLNLIRHMQVLYGDSWAVQGHLSGNQPTKFNEISYSVEFPRIENIDPEGMVLKRIFINSTITGK